MSDDLSEPPVSSHPEALSADSSHPVERLPTLASDRHFGEMARILERISDAFVALDSNWRYTYVNQQAAEIFGRRPEDLIGRHIWTEFPEGIGQPFYHAYYRAIAEQVPIEIEEYYPPYDRWFHNRIYPSQDGLSIFFQDITERKRDQERLRESERRLAESQRIARLGSWEWNIETGEVSWSREMMRLVGWDTQGPAPSYENTHALVHPDDRIRVDRQVMEAVEQGGRIDFENRMCCPDGREIVLHNWGHIVPGVAGNPLRLIAVTQEVTEQRKIEAALVESKEHFQAIAERVPVSIVIARLSDGAILYTNPFARQLFRVPLDVDVSRLNSAEFYQDPEDRVETVRLLTSHPYLESRELALKRMDGTPIWVVGSFQRLTYGGEEATLTAHHDITERKRVEQEREQYLLEAQERADLDPLTGLLNHRAFQKRLKDETARAQRENTTVAVIMLDLDNFKFFNDVYGHAVGDEVLRLVAHRLQQICRAYDTIARFGGDEFALLLPGVGRSLATEIEVRLRTQLEDLAYFPDAEGTAIPITVSVGVALYPYGGQDRQEVLRQADKRLFQAKTGGYADTEADQVRANTAGTVDGFSMLDALVTAVDNKDRYTRRHSEDVLDYSLMIARELGLDEVEQRTVAVAALVHDVGKIGVPDAILRKPGKLTDEEFKAIKQHPRMGAALVSTVPGLEFTLDAVRHHHERPDGTGYPSGLRGDACPLIARLMAVADAFSAMTTDRPYRQGMDRQKALSILEEGAGTQWDTQCVRAFLHAQRIKDSH